MVMGVGDALGGAIALQFARAGNFTVISESRVQEMEWIRWQLLRDLGIVGLCLIMLSGCVGIAMSTGHLKENIFDQILKKNKRNPDLRIFENNLFVSLNSLYKKSKSIDKIVDYYIRVGGNCDFGKYISCEYKNELRVISNAFFWGDETIGGTGEPGALSVKRPQHKAPAPCLQERER